MIEIQNLVKNYGPTRAVDHIDLTVKTGEVLGFLGPNGAGKTTVMKMITCYMPPTEGSIKVDNLDVMESSFDVRTRIGYLPEHNPLYMDMDLLEYLDFIADIRKMDDQTRRERIDVVVDICGLKTMLGKDIGELSKGYRQRVGLAQAILHDPDILILDEPTTGLDPNQIVEIRQIIRELGKEKTLIFSTHILQEVTAVCDRVVIINNGRIVADGSPSELQAKGQGKELITVSFSRAEADFLNVLKSRFEQSAISPDSDRGGEPRFFIESEKGLDLRPEVFKTAVDQGWTLLEMHREESSLEDVFRQLTSSREG